MQQPCSLREQAAARHCPIGKELDPSHSSAHPVRLEPGRNDFVGSNLVALI